MHSRQPRRPHRSGDEPRADPHTRPEHLFAGSSSGVSASGPVRSRFEPSRIGRRCRCLRATAIQPAAQQQRCIVARCRNVTRLLWETSRMIPQTAIAQIAKKIARELNSGAELSEEALAAGPILAEAGATPEIVGELLSEAQRNRPNDR